MISVFPTSVGMNRCCRRIAELNLGVPHERGDEPFRARLSA